MAFRLSPLFLLATALVIGAPEQQATASKPGGPEPDPRGEPRVVFKVRHGVVEADAAKIVTARLARDVARAFAPRGLRRVFAERPVRVDSGDRAAGLDRVYVSDLPRGLGMEDAAVLVAGDPRVEYAQPDYVRESHYLPDYPSPPSDPFFGSSGSWGQSYGDQWAFPKLNVEHAWDLSHGEEVVVAVVDSGVDYLHPELSGRMWANPEEAGQGPDNGYPGDTMGWDFVANDDDPQDQFGHGTHMAGIIAAETDNGIGIAGVAPAARIMAVRAIAGAGKGNSSTIAAGIVYAADNGARVIAVSSGCIVRCPSDPVVEQAVRHASAKGALVVISAGNNGDNLAYYSPQNMVDPRPIVVNATDDFDRRESFGNAGDFLDLAAPGGGRNPDPPVVGPVSNILSLAASYCAPIVCGPSKLVGSGYLRRHGTSMSAAYVAGVAALVLGADPLGNASSARRKLFANAQDFGPRGYDPYFGWGRVTGLNAVADLHRFILARIMAPASGATVNGPVRIVGAADARTFSGYEISVGAGAAPTTWQATGLTPVGSPTAQGDLARWNTEGLAAGTWTIRLRVYDTVGGVRESRRTVSVANTSSLPELVLDVASEGPGTGTVHVDPPRTFCDGVPGSTQTCNYTGAGPITLTAVPEGMAGFAGWSGACSGTGACTVDVTERHAVRASFRGPYKLVERIHFVTGGMGWIETDPYNFHCGPGATCWWRYGDVVTIRGYAAEPLSSWQWITPLFPVPVVMDRDLFVEGVATEFRPQEINISPIWEQRVPFGTPVTFSPHVYLQQYPPPVLYYTWTDEITGEFLGDTESLTVRLGPGLHKIVFSVADDNGNSAWIQFRVLVHDP
jgi:subtilisin family serine protease